MTQLPNPNARPKVRYICLGGGGVNLADHILSRIQGRHEVSIIDSSDSNTKQMANLDAVKPHYFRDEQGNLLDGAGQDRKLIYPYIQRQMPKIMDDIIPGLYNIVIATGVGGTGSMALPFAVKHLLEHDERFIVVLILEAATSKNVTNAINTIKGLKGLVNAKGKPISVLVYENTRQTPRVEIDQHILDDLTLLNLLFADESGEMDSRDVFNWLNYHNVTESEPDLNMMRIVTRSDGTYSDDNVISVATATTLDTHDTNLGDVLIDYEAKVIVQGPQAGDVRDSLPVHYVIHSGGFERLVDEYQRTMQQNDERRERRGNQSGYDIMSAGKSASVKDDGIVV